LAAAGRVAEAIKGLDGGIKKLGMVGALQRLAIDLEVRRKNIDGAVARIDRMAKITGRGDIWLARRGDIYLREGLHHEARVAYGQALAAIETSSQRRQNSRIVRKLRTRLKTLLCQYAATEKSAQLHCPKTPAAQAVSKK
jgi:predicted negative regulator of RcsB-dependent stress response